MKLLIFVLGLGLTFGLDLDAEWLAYKQKYGKVYSHVLEENFRRHVWEDNSNFIEKHNQEAARGEHSFRVAVNRFADMTNSEFRKLMTGLRVRNDSRTSGATFRFARDQTTQLPDAVDWREEGYVTPVKDQEQCGACWAFSTTGSLEGQWYKKTGDLIPLSEQNLVDCSKNGNLGCEGGFMQLAYLYIRDNDGIDTGESYPYEALDGPCRFQRQFVGATDTGYAEIEAFSEMDLQAAVAQVGPISVAMNAGLMSFQFYSSGVYYDSQCGSHAFDLNHAVLAVGYGTNADGDYWLVKNSWGLGWGDEGYVMMSRNRDNNCGIATDASFPLV